MKIGFDAKRLYNNFTGLGNFSRTLVGGLIERYPENEYYLYTPDMKIEPFKGAVTRTPSRRKGTWRSWGVKRDVVADGIDIYHGLSHDLPFGFAKTGVRSVVTIHDVCYKTFPDMFPMTERVIYGIKYRNSCKNADIIHAISESTKRDIVKYFDVDPDRIKVVYQAINPLFYSPQTEPLKALEGMGIPEKYILYVGAINSRKNLMGIVKSYEHLPEEMRVPLVVVGGGSSYKAKVLKYAERKGLMKYMTMLNSVKNTSTIQALYQCAECFVYPSFYEGFGLPVTEALLSGTPVITSNISSLPEAGGDAAFYVDPYSPEDIARAIERVLADRELVADMVLRGQEYAKEKFNPEILTQQINSLYKSLL